MEVWGGRRDTERVCRSMPIAGTVVRSICVCNGRKSELLGFSKVSCRRSVALALASVASVRVWAESGGAGVATAAGLSVACASRLSSKPLCQPSIRLC